MLSDVFVPENVIYYRGSGEICYDYACRVGEPVQNVAAATVFECLLKHFVERAGNNRYCGEQHKRAGSEGMAVAPPVERNGREESPNIMAWMSLSR